MLLHARHPDISKLEKTYLASAVSAAGTALTVASNNVFAANDYVVVGTLGQEKTELRQISSVSGDTTINVDALDFDHGKDTVITKIPFNQVRFYKASSSGGSFSVVQTSTIDVDQAETIYDYTSGVSTDYFKFAYLNSQTSTESTLSDEFAGTGPDEYNVGRIIDDFLAETGFKLFTRPELIRFIDNCLQEAVKAKDSWSDLFNQESFTTSASQQTKTLDSIASRIRRVVDVKWKNNWPLLTYVDPQTFWQMVANGASTSALGQPTHYSVIDRTLYFYPTIEDASDTVYVGVQLLPTQIDSEADSVPSSLYGVVKPYLYWKKAIREQKSAAAVAEAKNAYKDAVDEAVEADGDTTEPKRFVSALTPLRW